MNEYPYPSEAVEHYRRGLDFAEKEQYRDAIGEFKLAITATPPSLTFIDAYVEIADTYREWWDDPEAALSAYQKVVELDPTQTPSWCRLAWIAFVFRFVGEEVRQESYQKDVREVKGMMDFGAMTLRQNKMGKDVGKYRNLEQTALAHVRQQFPLIDPSREGHKLFDSVHAINALADKYAEKGAIVEAGEWYQRVAEVKPEMVVLDDDEDSEGARLLRDMVDHAKRRLVLVQEQVVKKEEADRRSRNRKLIWLGVAVVITIVLIFLCSATTFVPYS